MARKCLRWLPLLLLAVLLAVFVFLWKSGENKVKIKYEKSEAVLDNPFTGFAANADYVEAAEQTQMVYVDITWREWEPERGAYDYEKVASHNHLERWMSEGKQIVLRFVCDIPGSSDHLDIPDWLYEETGGDGTHYVGRLGMGYSPNYENTQIIQYHREAVAALGDYFAESGALAYVEMGSLGHWGEWHVSGDTWLAMPGDETAAEYVQPYVEAFPQAKILMRRPYAIGKANNFGVYNDMTGAAEDTTEWLNWIAEGDTFAVPSVTADAAMWERAPVGGEFTSSIPMETMLGDGLRETLELIRSSHMSFLGPKCPTVGYENYQEAIDAVKCQLGYRFYISEMELKKSLFGKNNTFRVTVENVGNAPFYFQWPLKLYVEDAQGEILLQQDLLQDIGEIKDGDRRQIDTAIAGDILEEAACIRVGITNPATGEPEILFAQNKAVSTTVDLDLNKKI
ncbi:MAG: DUF4832 domain-containing protein [Lachnospiraceae bacterium]|nr:DUF4832 domain-containing protein [Lachnospiraceae bacterium]